MCKRFFLILLLQVLAGDGNTIMAQTLKAPVAVKLRTNTIFPSLTVKDMQGNLYDTDSLRGKIIVFNFWFVHCLPCRQEIPELNKLVREFEQEKVVFLGLALDDSSMVKQFIELWPFDYQLIANGVSLNRSLGIYRYPTNMVVDSFGKIVLLEEGLKTTTVTAIRKKINELLLIEN